jgi:hypothetical protein
LRPSTYGCADGLDNDFDGRIDYPADPGCVDAADPNERSTKQCDNGIDDDHDGKIDWRGDGSGDPHCVNLIDNNDIDTAAAGRLRRRRRVDTTDSCSAGTGHRRRES